MTQEQSNYNINIKLEHKQNASVTVHCYILESYYFKFSARLDKLKKRNGRFYYAYKRIGGKLHKQYIGSSLNIETLENICLNYINIAKENQIDILKSIVNTSQELPNELPSQELPSQELPSQELPNKSSSQELPNKLPNESSSQELPNELPNLKETIDKALKLYHSKPKKSDKSSRDIIQELISFVYNQDVELDFKDKK